MKTADAEVSISEGQRLIDQLMASRNELVEIAQRLGKVKGIITGADSAGESNVSDSHRTTAFLPAVRKLANEFEQVAKTLNGHVDELVKTF